MRRASSEEEEESLEEETRAILEEARMVLPGVQALFGFQLIAIFNSTFRSLTFTWQVAHLAALLFCAVAMALVMTPAAYHRIAMRGRISTRFTKLASGLIAAAMAPLALSIGVDSTVVIQMVVENSWVATAVGLGLSALFAILWFVLPLVAAREKG